MKDYKIIQLLRSLSEEEYSEFVNFSSNRHFNPKRDYSKILRELKSIQSEKEDFKSLTTEQFYDRFSSDKKLNKQTLRNRFNELTRLAEKYFIEKEIERDEDLKNLLLLRSYKNKKLYNYFSSEIKTIENKLKSNQDKSFTKSEILKLKVYMLKETGNFPEMFRTFYEQIDYLFSYFLEILFDAGIEFEVEKTYKINPSTNILVDFMNNIKTDNLIKSLEDKKIPAYLNPILYYYTYKTFAEINDITWYKKLSKLFYSNLGKINNSTIDSISGYMISYLLIKINNGETSFLKDVFRLHKLKLKYNLTEEFNELRYPANAFRDFVVVGIRLKQYSWVENFIEKYSQQLPEEIRTLEICMAYARMYFVKKEFQKSLDHLNNLKTGNNIYILDASRFKLRIFYETLDFEKAFLEVDNIRHYIKNNSKRISLTVRKYSLEFIDYYNKLLKYRLNPQVKDLEYFSKEVRESKILIGKDWFLEKISEI